MTVAHNPKSDDTKGWPELGEREYEFWQISEKKPGVLGELAADQAKALEK